MSPTMLFVVLFWGGCLATVYAYVLFPAVVALVGRRRREESGKTAMSAGEHVPITIIIPAYNEEASLEARIRNVLDAQYPSALLDVIVVSDASTDRTNDIARGFENRGVRLIVQEARRGKTAGLNRAMAMAKGDVVVFTDANAEYPSPTLAALVRYFQDERVGLVTGYTRYTVTDAGHVSEATNAYTSLERVIKRAESKWGCCVGADGAIFAMRRPLYRTLRDDDINDFVLPLSVIEQGYSCVLAENAYCSEKPGKSLESEFRRQSRIANRSLRAIWRRAYLLNPVRFPAFSFFLFSHKVMRFLVPLFLLTSSVSLALLAPTGGVYSWFGAAALIVALILIAATQRPSLVSRETLWGRCISMMHVFVTINLAVLHGWWKFLSGYTEVTWQHDRALSR